MKILDQALGGACPPQFLPLLQAIASSESIQDLCATIKNHCVWVHDEQVDLQHMVPLLNRLDTALEGILGEYRKSLILDINGIEELRPMQGGGDEQAAEHAKIILDFTCMLLKNSVNKEAYSSAQHLLEFTKAFDDELAALALDAVTALAIPPLLHRSITDERHHLTPMHKEERLSEPIFDVLRASCTMKRLPLKELLTEFVDPSTFSSFEFNCTTQPIGRPSAEPPVVFRVDSVHDLPRTAPEALRQLVAAHSVPAPKQLELLWTVRMARAMASYDGRIAFARQHQQAIVILLATFPNTNVLASFFNDRSDIFTDAIHLLQTGPGSADYDPRIPLEFRLLATQALMALVATRDLSGSVMGRLAWIQHELGVQRGQYMGLLPCLLRASVSFLQLLSTDAVLLGSDAAGSDFVVSFDYAASLDILRSLGGDQVYSGLQSTSSSALAAPQQQQLVDTQPARAETSERLLWIEAILALTMALLSSANTLAALVDSGIVALLLAILRQDVNPSRSNLHVYVEAQVVQVFETAISHSSTALAACRDQNGLEILVARLGKELDLLRETSGDAEARTAQSMDIETKEATSKARKGSGKRRASKAKMEVADEQKPALNPTTTIPASRGVLLYSLLTAISMYIHERGGAHLNSLTRSTTFVSAFKRIFECADVVGPTIVTPALAIIAEVINNEPSVLSFFLSVGLVSTVLQAVSRPRENSEWLQTVPPLLHAFSLTTDGAAEVKKHDVFASFFTIFHNDAFVTPASRVLMGDAPIVLGGSFEELLRNSPALKSQCIGAVVDSLKKIVARGETYDSDVCDTQFRALLHHATNFGNFFDQLASRGGVAQEFIELGGLPLLMQLVRVLVKPARYILSSLGSVTDDAQPMVGHSPALVYISRCLLHAGREKYQATLNFLCSELRQELATLPPNMRALDATCATDSSGSFGASPNLYCNLLQKVPSDVLPAVFEEHRNTLHAFAAICGQHIVFKMILDVMAALLADRASGLRDVRRQLDDFLHRADTMDLFRQFLNDVYVPVHQEICRARGPLQHEFPSVLPHYTLLVTSVAESLPVRAEPNDKSEKVCRLERGTIVTSSTRQLSADNIVRYQIPQGWVSSSKSRSNNDAVLEVIDMQCGEPVSAIDEEAPLAVKLRQRDSLQLANASARRAGYVAFVSLSYSIGSLIRSLANTCTIPEQSHMPVRQAPEISPHVYQLLPIFNNTFAALMPRTDHLVLDELNLLHQQPETLPVTTLQAPPLDDFNLIDVSKCSDAVDFLLYLLSDSHRNNGATVIPLMLTHLCASGLLEQILQVTMAIFLCCLKSTSVHHSRFSAGAVAVFDSDLDTFPEGEHDNMAEDVLTKRLLKERRKFARLQLPAVLELWSFLADCGSLPLNGPSALYDAADSDHEFDQNILKRHVLAVVFKHLGNVFNHEQLWTLPTQSVRKIADIALLMTSKLSETAKLPPRSDPTTRRPAYRAARRGAFVPGAHVAPAIASAGYQQAEVERAMHLLRSNDSDVVTQYLQAQAMSATSASQQPQPSAFQVLRHLLPEQPRYNDTTLQEQKSTLSRLCNLLSRSFPSIIVTLIEQGVYRGSIRAGPEDQPLPPDSTREDTTATLVQQLLTWADHKFSKRPFVAVMLTISTLTDRIDALLSSTESVSMVDHKLYGVLHALVLLLAGKIHKSFSQDAIIYTAVGLPRMSASFKNLASVVERRTSSQSADVEIPNWVAPALLIFDVLCQPVVLPASSQLRTMLASVRSSTHQAQELPDGTIEAELTQFLTTNTSGNLSDFAFESPSSMERSIGHFILDPDAHESETMAFRDLFASRSEHRFSGRVTQRDIDGLVLGGPSLEGDRQRSGATAATPPKPAQLPLAESSLGDETMAKLFRACQNILSSPNETLTPPLVQAMLSLLVHLLRNLNIANEFRQWEGSTKLLGLSAAARFPGINVTLLSALQQAADNEGDLLQAMEHAIRSYVISQGSKRPQNPDVYQADMKRFVEKLSPLIFRSQETFFKALSNTAKLVNHGSSLMVAVRESPNTDETTSSAVTTGAMSSPIKTRKRRKSLSGGVSEASNSTNPISDVVHVLVARVIQKWMLGTGTDEDLQSQSEELQAYSIVNASEALSTLAELVLSMPGFATCIHKCNIYSLMQRQDIQLQSVVGRERISEPTFLAFLVNGILTVPVSSLECKHATAEGKADQNTTALKRARLLGQDLHASAKKLLLALCTRPGDGRRRTLQELLRALKVGSLSGAAATQPKPSELESIGHIVGCINDMMVNKTSKYYAEFTEKLPAKEIIRQLVGLRAHVILNELLCMLDVADSAAAQLCVEIAQPLEYLIRKGSVQVRIDDSAARKQTAAAKLSAQRGTSGASSSSVESPFRRPRSLTDDDRLSGSEVETTEQLERAEAPRRQEDYEEDVSSSDEEGEGDEHISIDDLHDEDEDEEEEEEEEEDDDEDELHEAAEEFLQHTVGDELVFDDGNVQFVTAHVRVNDDDVDDDDDDAHGPEDEGNVENEDEHDDGEPVDDGIVGRGEGDLAGEFHGDGNINDGEDGQLEDDDGDDNDPDVDGGDLGVRVVMNFNFEGEAPVMYFDRASSQDDDAGADAFEAAEELIEENEEDAMEQLDDEGSNLDVDEQDEDNSPIEVEFPLGEEGHRAVRYRTDAGLADADEAGIANMLLSGPVLRARRGGVRGHNFLSLPRPRSPPTLGQARVTRPVRIRLAGGDMDDVHALLFGGDLEVDPFAATARRGGLRDRSHRHDVVLMDPLGMARREPNLRAGARGQIDPAFSDASDRRLEDHPLLQTMENRGARVARSRYTSENGVGSVVSSLVGMLGGGGFRHRQRGSTTQAPTAANARWGMHGLNRVHNSNSPDQLIHAVTEYIRSTVPIATDVDEGVERREQARAPGPEEASTVAPDGPEQPVEATVAMEIEQPETKEEGEQQETKEEGEPQETKQDIEEPVAVPTASVPNDDPTSEAVTIPATTAMPMEGTQEAVSSNSAMNTAGGEPAMEATATSNTDATALQCPPNVDPEVFMALPEEMQRELVEQYRSQDVAVSSLLAESALDRDTLAALPDNIRQEVLQEEAAERRRRESIDSGAAPVAAASDPAAAQAAADIDFITSLPPDLRRDALLTASDEFLRSLPEDIQREARGLRQRFRLQNALEGIEPMLLGGRGNNVPGTGPPRRFWAGGALGAPRRQRAGMEEILQAARAGHSAAPVDPMTISLANNRKGKCPSGRLVLVQLLTMILRVPDGSTPRPLQRLLAALCRYEAARRTIVQLVVHLLQDPRAMQTIRTLLGFLPLDRRGALRAAKTTEQLESMFDNHFRTLELAVDDRTGDLSTVRRLIGVLHYLCRKTDGLVSFEIMLPRKTPEHPGIDEWIFERIVQLLSKGTHDHASNYVEYVIQLLAALFTMFEKLDIASASKLVELQVSPEQSTHDQTQEEEIVASASNTGMEAEPMKKKAKATSSSSTEAAPQSAESSIAVEVSHDQAQRDLTAMKQDTPATDEEPRARLQFPILNPEMARNFCQLVASDHFHGATRKNLTHILQVASLYEGNWRVLLSNLQEIATGILEQVMVETDFTLQVLDDILQQQGDSVVAMTAPQLASPSRVTELVLLQVLQVMTSLRPTDENQQQVVATYMAHINFGRLWDDLSECLDRVRKLEGLQDAGNDEDVVATDSEKKVDDNLQGSLTGLTMRFMPLIECFFLVVSSTLQSQSHSAGQIASRKRGREHEAEDAQVGDDSKESEPAVGAITSDLPEVPQPNLDIKIQPYIPGERFRQSPEFQQMQMEVGSDPNGLRLIAFVQRNRALLNMVLRQNHLLEGSFSPIIKIPRCRRFLHFDIKRTFFKSKMRKIKHTATRQYGTLRVAVRRSKIFEDSFNELRRASTDEMRKRLSVIFHGEEGVDAGGVTREWYGVLAREIFNENYALFRSTHDGVTFQPNPLSYVNKDHLDYFRFVGRIIGKAVCDGHLLDAHFTRSFYKHILGVPVTYHDVEGMDPEYYKNLQQILEYPLDDLGLDLTFSAEASVFGQVEIVDLIPDGRNIPVTDDNKMDYVRLITHHRMTSSIQPQIDAFLDGFHDLVPPELISIFNEHELELLISGLPDIDLDDWKANTEYHGYRATDDQISWFWNTLKSFSREEQALFLQFVTGTSKVPLDGFAALQGMRGPQKFNIHKAFGSHLLPSAHTCFNQLDLPSYATEEELRDKLLLAIKEGSEGFAFA